MRVRASVNSVAMKTVKIIYHNAKMLVALAMHLIELGSTSTYRLWQSSLEIGYLFLYIVLKPNFVETADRQLNGII